MSGESSHSRFTCYKRVKSACATLVCVSDLCLFSSPLQNARRDGGECKQFVAFCGRHLQIACLQTMEARVEWHYSWIVSNRRSSNMNGLNGYAILVLISFVSILTTGAFESPQSPADAGNSTVNRNSTVNGTTTLDDGLVPMVLTTINQIIAREGNCVLIDCNVTGEPFPDVEWFNSHGQLLLDNESKWHLMVDLHSRVQLSNFAPCTLFSMQTANRKLHQLDHLRNVETFVNCLVVSFLNVLLIYALYYK